ncbi:MAG: NADH-quinone oxidoreductase subunit NuoE [Bacteroidia bacterium]|nr:NADH-quinone oxidoreductase subunit NuoE [Bacteroidia bacterium]
MMTEKNDFVFSADELKSIEAHVAKYPEKRSAVMPALWIAQEKFGWLSEEAIKLVADTLDLPYSHVYGVASFYTMYFKKKAPKHLIEVCTCFSCSITGGPETYEYVKEKIEADESGFGKEGKIWVRQAECLGACDTAPMCQITNRTYVHNLTEEKVDELIEKLRKDEEIPFQSVPLKDQSVVD